MTQIPPEPRASDDLLAPTIGAPAPEPGPARQEFVGSLLAGRYRILKKLGEGAMGAVYLGEHVKIGRRDAIKVLRDQLARDNDAVARFVRGTRNVSMIRHPNICTIYDYSDTADGLQFVAMELVEGETLKDLLEREGALPLERGIRIAVQVAEALDAAHEAGIVHRDLKPANIMVTRGRKGGDEIKVVDFDIAKGPEDSEGQEVTKFGFVVGTPEYMSPEQLIGDRLDGRSDIYSLGLVLIRTLTGSLPFRAESTHEMMLQRLTGKPLRLEDILPQVRFPAVLQSALDRALAQKPADRHATAGEFAQEILQAISPGAADNLSALRVGGSQARLDNAPRVAQPELPPETRISPPPAPLAASGMPGGNPVGGRRRTALLAGAGVGVLAIALAATLLLTGDPESEAEPAAPTISQTQADPSTPALVPPLVDTPVQETATLPEPPPAIAEAERPQSERSRPVAEPRRTVVVEAPVPARAEEDANSILFRQFERIGPPYPSRAALSAVRDTAQAVWSRPGVARNERAFAAYILGSTLVPLGDTVQAVTWFERAVELRPNGPGYADILDTYRKLIR